MVVQIKVGCSKKIWLFKFKYGYSIQIWLFKTNVVIQITTWLFNDPLGGKRGIQVIQIRKWFLAGCTFCDMVIQIQIWLLESHYGYSNRNMVGQIAKWLFKSQYGLSN